jgi:glucokinase
MDGTISAMSAATSSSHLGVDVGGTNLKWVVLQRDEPALHVLDTGQVRTDTSRGERSVVEQLIGVARDSSQKWTAIESVGVGMPGLYDPVEGTTRFMPNVPGNWAGVPVAAELSATMQVPTRLINDARAFTLAEHQLGAGRGAGSMLGITLGTGVGGGLILGGRLYQGHDGTAGEFGHQTILPDGPLCNCGNRGCLEALAKADAIVAICGQPTVEQCVEAAHAGDSKAQQGLIAAGQYLGIGVSNVLVLLSVDRVVVGGGIAAAGEILLEPLRAELRRRVFVTDVNAVEVVGAELGIWAGAIGAALHGAGAAPAVG